MKIKPINDDRYTCLMVIPMIKYATLQRFKRVFPSLKNESAKDYFQRLARHLEYEALESFKDIKN